MVKLTNFYYAPIKETVDFLVSECADSERVLEIGPGAVPFPLATTFIGFKEHGDFIEIDIDTQKIPFGDHHFDFMYCRHVLEDIQNPDFAISEIFRVSKRGYIETPSPLIEMTKGVDSWIPRYCGYVHHRYIVWSYGDTVYFLPKYPVIEYVAVNNDRNVSIANEYPMYWNNYIMWDAPMKVVMYKNGVNMDIVEDYATLLNRAVVESAETTDAFFTKINNKILDTIK